jgi:RNA polymerase sigma-70 factor (ECF subfamily)
MFRLNNQQQAEDLTGEVFVRMLKALPGYQERKIPFEAWLYRIARNLLIDEYRKERIRQSYPLHEMDHILGDDGDHEKLCEMDDRFVRQALQMNLLEKYRATLFNGFVGKRCSPGFR